MAQKGAVLCGGEMTFCPEQISLICFSSFFFLHFFFHTDKNDYYHQRLTSSGIHMNEQERERHIKQNKICEGCFSHVQTLTSLVRWLNKFFSFNASLV